MKRLFLIGLSLSTIGLIQGGCNGEPNSMELENGELSVCYRGSRVPAAMLGGELVVEGDILVAPTDQWCDNTDAVDEGDLRSVSQEVRIQGASYRWRDGLVPYRFGSDPDADGDGVTATAFSAAERSTLEDRMTELEELVPGLEFRPAKSSDTDVIEFRPSLAGCNSFVGRIGGTQAINLPDWCISTRSASHEIMHALGIYHQHTRKDRTEAITVNWDNIKGCTSTATSSAQCGASACASNLADCGCTATDVTNQSCYMAGNFTTNNSRADIGSYDYGSVMHYGRWGFSKGGATIDPVDATATIGQRAEISLSDAKTLSAMYPVLRLHKSAFVTAGVPTQLCRLVGRSDDEATKMRLINPGGAKAFEYDGEYATFDEDVGLTVYNRECGARSNFWAKNYDYPNKEPSNFGTGHSFDELFETEGDTVLMTAGLLPALF